MATERQPVEVTVEIGGDELVAGVLRVHDRRGQSATVAPSEGCPPLPGSVPASPRTARAEALVSHPVPGCPVIRADACAVRGRPGNERGRGVNHTALASHVRPVAEVSRGGYPSLKSISAHHGSPYVQLIVPPSSQRSVVPAARDGEARSSPRSRGCRGGWAIWVRDAPNIASDRLQSSDRHNGHVCHVRGQSSEVTRITGEEAHSAAERSRGHGNDCVDGVVPAGPAE